VARKGLKAKLVIGKKRSSWREFAAEFDHRALDFYPREEADAGPWRRRHIL